MSDDEFESYRARLCQFVTTFIDEVEAEKGRPFDLFIAHHAFLNPLVMADVNRARVKAGKTPVPLFAFVHGTSLLMFIHEKEATNPEYPSRFFPQWKENRVFDDVAGVFVISNSQKERFLSVFEDYEPDHINVAPNGIDPATFRPLPPERASTLGEFDTKPYPGSSESPVAVPTDPDKMVLFVGKFADIKRIDCLLQAATHYEPELKEDGQRVITVIAGSGPPEEQQRYQEMAHSLGLNDVYFIGPHDQPTLAKLYSAADIGVFPTKFEAFGLVYLECMACGTPAIGTAAGGPLEFVDSSVGELVHDYDSNDEFGEALGLSIAKALKEDWKKTKGAAALERSADYTLVAQCERMLASAFTSD